LQSFAIYTSANVMNSQSSLYVRAGGGVSTAMAVNVLDTSNANYVAETHNSTEKSFHRGKAAGARSKPLNTY
jgi:hypothetical protein